MGCVVGVGVGVGDGGLGVLGLEKGLMWEGEEVVVESGSG